MLLKVIEELQVLWRVTSFEDFSKARFDENLSAKTFSYRAKYLLVRIGGCLLFFDRVRGSRRKD